MCVADAGAEPCRSAGASGIDGTRYYKHGAPLELAWVEEGEVLCETHLPC